MAKRVYVRPWVREAVLMSVLVLGVGQRLSGEAMAIRLGSNSLSHGRQYGKGQRPKKKIGEKSFTSAGESRRLQDPA